MKIFVGVVLLFSFSAFAQYRDANQLLSKVYGSFSTACTQDADADTAQHNRLAMAAGVWFIYCHNGTGTRIACECLQGTSSVDASAAVGVLVSTDGLIVTQRTGNTHISCVPFTDNQMYDICPLQ